MKKYLTPFQNVKFNIWLFSLLAGASVLGTLVPQVQENPEKVEHFILHSPRLGALFQKLDFFNVYYSWWFVGLLGLLAFDVIVCKLIFGKFPGLRTFKKEESFLSAARSQQFRSEWTVRFSPEETARRIGQILQAKKYGAPKTVSDESGGIVLLAARHRLQRFGSWVSHVSILIILLANLTGALYGFREVLNVVEGTSAKMKNRSWVVNCDKFFVEWYENSSAPKTFASDLRLFEKGNLAAEKRILVNEPLEYKKVRFYQASYGPYLKEARLGFFLRKNPKRSPTVTLRPDEDVPVPGTPYTLRILEFVPDFSLNEKREVSSRSPQPNNPALQILVSQNGKPLKAPWIFENFPTLQMPPVQKEDEFILLLAEVMPAYYTGLQITYDPGADLFWLACTILVLGLMALFYFHHRKVWVFISQGSVEGEAAVLLVGFSSRGKSFESEFSQLAEDCRVTS